MGGTLGCTWGGYTPQDQTAETGNDMRKWGRLWSTVPSHHQWGPRRQRCRRGPAVRSGLFAPTQQRHCTGREPTTARVTAPPHWRLFTPESCNKQWKPLLWPTRLSTGPQGSSGASRALTIPSLACSSSFLPVHCLQPSPVAFSPCSGRPRPHQLGPRPLGMPRPPTAASSCHAPTCRGPAPPWAPPSPAAAC